MGRRLLLTPEVQDAICKTLQFGVDVPTACAREGISQATYYSWRKQGEQGQEPFASFLAATEKAMAELEAKVTVQILKQSQANWQAGAWWLRFRKTGGKQQVELTGPGGGPLTGTLSPEAAEVIREKILYGDKGNPVKDRRKPPPEREPDDDEDVEPPG